MYCGEVAEMIQPLLLIGMKTPMSMEALLLPRSVPAVVACDAGLTARNPQVSVPPDGAESDDRATARRSPGTGASRTGGASSGAPAPGRSLAPASWPGGARCAVALSFDADHETIPLRDADESPMRISQGQYGARQGVPRIRALLARHGVPAILLLPRRLRAAAPGGSARGGRRRPRDRHPFLDPRGEHAAAARRRARPDLPRRRYAGEA